MHSSLGSLGASAGLQLNLGYRTLGRIPLNRGWVGWGGGRSRSLPVLDALPSTLRRVLPLSAAFVVLAAVFVTGYAHSAENLGRPPSLGRQPDKRPVGVGATVFKGDFEPGNISQWTWGAQCANTGVPSSAGSVRGTITVQSEVVADGKYGARIDLPAAPADKTACEALSKRSIGLGTDDYYGMMIRFPRSWREPSPVGWGLSIAQLNFQNIWGAPVILAAHANDIGLILQSGFCKSVFTSKPGCTFSSGPSGNVKPMLAVRAPLALDVWHQLIVHVRWATNSTGALEVWHRLKGGGKWNKTASLRGYPTVQWTTGKGRRAIAGSVTSDKIGAYRGRADFPLTVWHDGFVRTRSFAATASALQ